MDYLPIFIDARSRACLVVGGGHVAARKVELLRAAGAIVHVVALELCAELELQALALADQLRVELRAYAARDVRDKWLVVAATGSHEVNARVAEDAKARSIPVNVVDSPAQCTFIMPAIIDRSPVLVAVSTAGASPVLARLTRERIELALPQRLGRLAVFAARHRATVKERIPEPAPRRAFWERILDGEVAEQLLEGRDEDAERAFVSRLSRADARGVGASATLLATGDGDIERLSLRAVRTLGSADVLIYERARLDVLNALGRRDAERVDIDRLGGDAGAGSLDALARAVAERVALGLRVCVVRAGDPYASPDPVEAQALRELGVRAEILRPAPKNLGIGSL